MTASSRSARAAPRAFDFGGHARCGLAIVLTGCAFFSMTVSARALTSSAAKLAQRYAPVMALHPQTRQCGPGEAYRPSVVSLVLGNPEVVLRDSRGQIVKHGPTASDLYGARASDYLDLPGDPLSPGCRYERDFRRWYGNRRPSVYARVATDPEHPGKLAVQYWFYYTFNDFTNKHESDWEMAQVDFNGATPEQALEVGPYEVDLSQHAGGERGAWNHDPKLVKQDTHPVIYIATGSHAAYFDSNLYLGTGGSEGFGCEDTRHATARVPLETVLLPSNPPAADSTFAWLAFRGRWGQKLPGINNGPTGPASKDPWAHPIGWADGLRSASLTVPGARALGLSVTSFFCGGVTNVSIALNWAMVHPVVSFVLLAIVAAISLAQAHRTRWRPSETRPLRRLRAGGQILRGSRRLYQQNLFTFIAIGAIFIPVAGLEEEVQSILFHLTPVQTFVSLDGARGAATVFLALLIGASGGVVASAAVTGAVSAALGELDAGRAVTARSAYTLAARKVRPLAGATARQVLLSVLLVLTVIGIPVAIYRFIRTSLFAQACVLENRTARDSLRASASLTRGQWWRTLGFTVLVDTLTIVSGPILGVAILLVTARSLGFIDIAGSVIYALTVPYAAIALTLYYFDLEARRAARTARS